MKRFMVFCFAFILILFNGYTTTSFAVEEKTDLSKESFSFKQQARETLASELMLQLLSVYISDDDVSGLSLDDIYNLYYGELFSIPRVEEDFSVSIPIDQCYCPLLKDDRIVALIRFCYTEEAGIQYVISAGYCDVLNEVRKEKVFFMGQSLCREYSLSMETVDGRLAVAMRSIPELNYQEIIVRSRLSIGEMMDAMGAELHSRDALQSPSREELSTQRSLVSFSSGKYLGSYPIVAQGSNPWCWAATISSIVRYEQSSTTPTMYQVQSWAGLSNGATLTQAKNILKHYLSSPYVPTKYGRAMTQNEIKTIIGNNDPALMDAHSSGSGHMTALTGYVTSGDLMAIRMMNPGTGQIEWTGYTDYRFTFSYNGKIWSWDGTVRLLYE